MVKPLNIGIIGLGHVATKAHIPAINKLRDVRLVAVADIDAKKLRLARKRIGKSLKLYTDYSEMLEQDDVDLIIVCLPPSLHGQATLQALEARKHVLVEKPFTINLNEAFKITEMSLKVDRKVCTVHNYRYFPAAMETKKKILAGLIGKILCINTVAHIQPPSVSTSKMWVFSPWGILEEFGPHPIDMTNWLISSAPSTVYCFHGALKKASSLTDIRMMITYEDGSVSTIGISWLAGTTKFELSIMGSGGEIILNVNLNQMIEHHGTITPYHQIKDFINLTKRNLKNIFDGTIFKGSYVYHATLLQDFIESINQNKPPPITLTESLRNVAVSEGAKISLKESRVITLNELPLIKKTTAIYGTWFIEATE